MTRARTHRARLLGLCVGALIGVCASAGYAQAAPCSGTIGPVLNERGREVPTLSFRCDVPIGGNFDGRLFRVAFSNRSATTLKEPMLGKRWLEDYVGQCDPVSPQGADGQKSYVECTALTETADSVTVPAGETVTGTPWDAARDMPVCSVAADVTVYGAAGTALASFPLLSTCPADWTVRNALTVTITGNGRVSGAADGIACGGGTCIYRYPVGTRVSLSAMADRGARFAGWSGDCIGTAPRCSVVLDDDLTVVAKFAGGPAPPAAGKLQLSVDRPATLGGVTVSAVLGCQGPRGSSCKVLAVLSSSKTTKKIATPANQKVTIAAGTQKTVSLSLNATGKALLRRVRTLPARLTVSLTNGAKPTVIFSKAMTFRQQQPTRR